MYCPLSKPPTPYVVIVPACARLVSLSCDRAHGALLRAFNAWVRDNLVLMVTDCRLGDRAHILQPSLQDVWVVWREDGGRGAHDRAEGVVELLRLGLLDGRLKRGAGSGFGCGEAGDVGVLVEVVVVVGRCAYNRALWVSASRDHGGEGAATV